MQQQQYVMVSGDFNQRGGMDRANYALAWYLANHLNAPVHIVSFRVQSPLAEHPNVRWHRVPKLLDSYTLSEGLLDRAGQRVAKRLAGARVIVNGGNCNWPDVNWVHALHASWDRVDQHAPAMFRARARYMKWAARRKERRALTRARLIIVNSDRTRRDL